MYNPKQTGFFPIIQHKIEEGLSQQEKDFYLGLPSLEEKLIEKVTAYKFNAFGCRGEKKCKTERNT